MKKNIVIIILCAGICLLEVFPVEAEEARARITQVVGKVEVRAKGTAVWRPARLGMPVREGWDVRSYVEAEAEVTFENGTKLRIGENSVVTLSRLKADAAVKTSQSTVKILTGKVWANVKKLTETQSEFEFETPTAVASIRGTRLGIDVEKKQTLIDVFEGLVNVRRKGGTASVEVTANMRAVVDRDKKDIAVIAFAGIRRDDKKQGGDTPPSDPFADESEPAEQQSDTAGTQPIPGPSDTAVIDTGTGQRDMGGGSLDNRFTEQRLVLTVTAPAEGARISEPLIQVTGTTLPGAKVFVNEIQAAVGRDGVFGARLPIPDEPYTYSVEIRAEYGGAELTQQRRVVYAPHIDKLQLECTSPHEGQVIKSKTIRISGKTAPRATVTANGVPVSVAGNGVFNGELTVTEKDIGDFQLEVIARNENEELSKTFNLEIDGSSPQINTSMPICLFSMQGQQATMQRTIPLQLLDRTPGDELTLKITNNGSIETTTSEPGRTEQFLLNEGANDYSIQVFDRAGNASPLIRGKIYCLPGPIILLLNEPSSNPMIYEGLPPALHPGNRGAEESVDVEVEIDDGIGNVPQSIHYCRVTGNGQTVQLRNNNDYIYVGKVNVRRGSNQFTVQVEDLSGRLETLRFEVVLR